MEAQARYARRRRIQLNQTAAVPRLCAYHRRAGVAVPAAFFVGKDAFCSDCFNGKPLFSPQRKTPGCEPRRSAPLKRAESKQESAHAETKPVIRPRPQEIAAYIPGPAAPAESESAPAPPSCNPHLDHANTTLFDTPPTPRPQPGAALSPREIEVLRLLTENLQSTKEIATALGISARTVKFHIANAYAKSGKHDRWSLMGWFSQGRAPAPVSLAKAKEEIELRSLLRASLARIEAELAAVTCAVRDRVAQMERELEECSSPPTKS